MDKVINHLILDFVIVLLMWLLKFSSEFLSWFVVFNIAVLWKTILAHLIADLSDGLTRTVASW